MSVWSRVEDRHRDLQTQIAGSRGWARWEGLQEGIESSQGSFVESDLHRVALRDDSAKLGNLRSERNTTGFGLVVRVGCCNYQRSTCVVQLWLLTIEGWRGQPAFCTLILLAKVRSTSLQLRGIRRGRRRQTCHGTPASIAWAYSTPGGKSQQVSAELLQQMLNACASSSTLFSFSIDWFGRSTN